MIKVELLQDVVTRYNKPLKDPYDVLYEMFGFDFVIELCDTFESTSIYVPTANFFFKPRIEVAIRKEFDGQNYVKLAKKYDCSVSTIRDVLKKAK